MWKFTKLTRSFVLCLVISTLVIFVTNRVTSSFSRLKMSTTYKTYLNGSVKHNPSRLPKILLYTPFFRSWEYYRSYNSCLSECDVKCTATIDKNEIRNSDIVMFHLWDVSWQHFEFDVKLLKSFTFPSYRNPQQVWVAYNLEPPTMLWGDYKKWNGLFNWTMSYRSDSEVFTPYGRYVAGAETKSEATNENHFRQKTKDAIALISNCYDENRRYRIIAKLKQYINVDIFGDCGKPCPGGRVACEQLVTSYKFLVAIENSYCKDYVTEKVFRAYSNNVIPIVAWTSSMNATVPPHSFINIYDFPTLPEAFNHIKTVKENESQYNQYFRWKTKYHKREVCAGCALCRTFHSNLSARVYTDMHGWLTNDTCKQSTMLRKWHRTFDRLSFKFMEHIF